MNIRVHWRCVTEALRDGLLCWSALDAPWLGGVDAAAFDRTLQALERLDPSVILGGHLPAARDRTRALTAILAEATGARPTSWSSSPRRPRQPPTLKETIDMNGPSDTQQSVRNRAVVGRFLDGTHAGDLDVIDDTVAEGIVTHGFPGGRNPDSREAYKQFFREFATAFADMRYRTLALLADGDHVAARFEVSVRHIGQFAGRAATGRRVSFTGMALYRLERGRIAETWLHLDEAALLGQLGAVQA